LKESELSDGSRRRAGREFQTTGPATEKAPRPNLFGPVISWYVELTAAGGAKTLTTGDVGGQRATVDQILWSLALHASVNSRSELVLDPLSQCNSV